ncbi:Autophagy-related protein 27 [Pleurostoma richardsiae]|uniref:Autophagy-related protein 27 n=1 Tax=Pleurostoma richardsiae TaxID=41990 RepID=A0AA38RJ03_9PEZI|nr:Autophagy-related protein 27 [Pleurostoma richardsiae]
MRFSRSSAADAAFLSLLLAAPSAAMLRCDHIQVDGQKFNFKELGGPHSVVTSKEIPPNYLNTTYTLDLCRPLKKKSGAPKRESCPNGTRVCAIQRTIDPEKPGKDGESVHEVIPIAGDLENYGGGPLDFEATRLSTSDSNSDAKKEGVRLVLKGGKYPLGKKPYREQRTVIELLCDPKRTGLEGEWTAEDEYEKEDDSDASSARKREDGDDKEEGGDKDGGDKPEGDADGEKQLLKENASLIFESYGPLSENSNVDVLRLTWQTKYACESTRDDEGSGEESAHWGFFTWLVIIVFLATASYLIFGSWLNYNRYGARGWDLLPHGDTLRDVPYLLKDWVRRVLNTVQGSGTRGGYSAV